MGRKLIYPIAWCLCHCAMVSAQDVFISPVFEVLEQERSSPRMMGASLAFRFPFGADRYVFEVRPGILQSEWMDLPDAYERRDKRVGGSIAFLRTQRLNAFSVDYGLVAGWHRRTISLHHHSASEVLAYQTLGQACNWPYVTRDHRSFNRSFHSVHTTSIHWTMWIRSSPASPLPKGSGVLLSGSESFWGYLPPLDHKLPEGRVFDPACRESFPKMITPPSPPAAGAAGARKALRSPTKLTFRVRSPG